jgi:hypothetical protein
MSEDQQQNQESEEFFITFEQKEALLEYLSYSPINKERYIKAYLDYKNKLSIEFLHDNYIADFKNGKLFNRKTNKELGSNFLGYKRVSIKGKAILLHIIIFAMYHNRWPHLGILVDHDDNNPLNNSISNLKEVDYEGNNENTEVFNHGIKVYTLKNGVKKFYVSRFKTYIGSFNTHEEAMSASLSCKKEDVLKVL